MIALYKTVMPGKLGADRYDIITHEDQEMKIEGFDPTDGKVGKQNSVEPVKGPAFKEVLDNLTSKNSVEKSSSTSHISQVPFIHPPVNDFLKVSSAEIVGGVEDILLNLEMFSNSLGNNNVPLARLEPLVDELTEQKDDLAAWLGQTTDEELKSMVSETLSLLIEQLNLFQTRYAA